MEILHGLFDLTIVPLVNFYQRQYHLANGKYVLKLFSYLSVRNLSP